MLSRHARAPRRRAGLAGDRSGASHVDGRRAHVARVVAHEPRRQRRRPRGRTRRTGPARHGALAVRHPRLPLRRALRGPAPRRRAPPVAPRARAPYRRARAAALRRRRDLHHRRRRPRAADHRARARAGLSMSTRTVAGLLALAVLAGTGLAVLFAGGSPPRRCNGAAALCDRRLDQVVFAATHNSYAASDQPGWRFAPQGHGIARQLDDGIRALLLDVHYGVTDPATGTVRTDLRAEDSDRNKVAQQLSPAALRVADRIAGRIGAGTLRGEPKPYLCHTLCELGAEPLGQELAVIRRFLRGHPGQVVLLVVEDYVPPATIARAFKDAGLEGSVATLDRRRPLPTLGALVANGRRLVVFAED